MRRRLSYRFYDARVLGVGGRILFLAPNRLLLEQGLHNRLWQIIYDGLRSFVGQTAFEDICRAWTMQQAAAGRLPFLPDGIGRHWSQEAEIDVAAINWSQRHLLLGECKWGTGKVGRNVIRSLVDDRGARVLSRLDGEWQVHYAFFARTGFTAAALREAAQVGATTATLAELDKALLA